MTRTYDERLDIETYRVLRTMRRKGLTANASAPLAKFAAKRIAAKHLEIARQAALASEYPKVAPKDFKAYWLNSRVRAGIQIWYSGNHMPDCPGFASNYTIEYGFVSVNRSTWERVKARYPDSAPDPLFPHLYVLFRIRLNL